VRQKKQNPGQNASGFEQKYLKRLGFGYFGFVDNDFAFVVHFAFVPVGAVHQVSFTRSRANRQLG
jgi:hypothetical protein